MAKKYSTHEARAKFSEVLRQVRQGETVTVTYRGEAVAEIRPIQQPAGKAGPASGIEERLNDLRRLGVLVPSAAPVGELTPLAEWTGAVEWLLEERDE